MNYPENILLVLNDDSAVLGYRETMLGSYFIDFKIRYDLIDGTWRLHNTQRLLTSDEEQEFLMYRLKAATAENATMSWDHLKKKTASVGPH